MQLFKSQQWEMMKIECCYLNKTQSAKSVLKVFKI